MKKMLPWLIVILLAVTLIVGAAFVLWNSFMRDSSPTDPREAARAEAEQIESKPLSAEEVAEVTFAIDEMITNLANPNYFVNISLTFEMDSPEAKQEFELLSFKVRDVINTTLLDMTPEQVHGSAGVDAISSELINKTNELLREGKVRHVYVTKLIITEQ